MNSRRSVLLVTLAVGIPATFLGFVLWPPQHGGPEPTPPQFALFVALYATEALLFGFGIAFAAFGLPALRAATRAAGVRTWPVFISMIWLLLAWWPHDGFHRVTADGDLSAILRIEYAFHFTLASAGAVCAYFFLAMLRTTLAPRPRALSREATGDLATIADK